MCVYALFATVEYRIPFIAAAAASSALHVVPSMISTPTFRLLQSSPSQSWKRSFLPAWELFYQISICVYIYILTPTSTIQIDPKP